MGKIKELLKPRSLIGLTIITIALFILLENLGLSVFRNVIGNWPLGLIIIGVAMLYGPSKSTRRTTPYILIGLGVLFMLGLYNVFNIQWSKFIIPVLLLLLGIYFLKPRWLKASNGERKENSVEVFSILSASEYNTQSKYLNGGNVTCLLGGAEVNMCDGDMLGDIIELDVLSLMSGVEIKVPAHWQVSVKAIPFLGSISNETTCLAEELQMPKKILVVKGLAIMGGIDLRN